jgi:UPF0271 protein
MKIDINSDLGEGFGVYTLGDDAALMPLVSSANIACGFHAGDPLIMHRTAALALRHGVQVGAHPGFGDLWGFGRRVIQGDRPEDIEKMLTYQIGAMSALAASAGTRLRHVKTHGSLGNIAAEDLDLARAVAGAVRAFDRDLIFVVMPGTQMERAGEEAGLRLAREIYADRAYADNGNLMSRKLPGAVIHDADEAFANVARMLDAGTIFCSGGKRIETRIDTVCVHGDTPSALAMARHLRASLEKKGLRVVPMSEVLDSR